MDDPISRQAAIKQAEKESQVDGAYGYMDTKSIVDMLNDLPSIQPKRGMWIGADGKPVPWSQMDKRCPEYSCHCSECGEWLVASDEYAVVGNFCPNCGAQMVMKEDGLK